MIPAMCRRLHERLNVGVGCAPWVGVGRNASNLKPIVVVVRERLDEHLETERDVEDDGPPVQVGDRDDPQELGTDDDCVHNVTLSAMQGDAGRAFATTHRPAST